MTRPRSPSHGWSAGRGHVASTRGGVRPRTGRTAVVTSSPDLISQTTRREVRNLCAAINLFSIETAFAAEGFVAGPEPTDDLDLRRGAAASFLNVINWTDRDEVHRALRVFEWLLRLHEKSLGEAYDPTSQRGVRDALQADGFRVDADGVISSAHPGAGLREESLANLGDASAIRLGLARVAREVDTDPHGAIGAAKELIESTAKVVLHQRELPVNDRDDVSALARKAANCLDLAPGPNAADAIQRILGGLSDIPLGMAQLRNRGYGRGHGPPSVPVDLGPRHARLAVGAATVWCQLLLDTLEDPTAFWRRSAP